MRSSAPKLAGGLVLTLWLVAASATSTIAPRVPMATTAPRRILRLRSSSPSPCGMVTARLAVCAKRKPPTVRWIIAFWTTPPPLLSMPSSPMWTYCAARRSMNSPRKTWPPTKTSSKRLASALNAAWIPWPMSLRPRAALPAPSLPFPKRKPSCALARIPIPA